MNRELYFDYALSVAVEVLTGGLTTERNRLSAKILSELRRQLRENNTKEYNLPQQDQQIPELDMFKGVYLEGHACPNDNSRVEWLLKALQNFKPENCTCLKSPGDEAKCTVHRRDLYLP